MSRCNDRLYIAAQALKGLLARGSSPIHIKTPQERAQIAVEHADALLEALERENVNESTSVPTDT